MRSELQPEKNYGYRPGGLDRQSILYFGASFAAHMILVMFLLLMPEGKESHGGLYRFESIDVQLVSLNPGLPLISSGGEGSGEASTQAVADETSDVQPFAGQEPESAAIPIKSGTSRNVDPSEHTLTLPKELSAPEPAVKAPASQRPSRTQQQKLVLPEDLQRQDSGRRVADTVKRLEQETEEDRGQASVRRRIDQLAGEVGTQASRGTGSPSGSGSGGRGGRSGGVSAENYTRIQVYRAEVSHQLRKNWAFSEALAGNTRGLESRIVMRIMPDGEIRDIWFDKRSGNAYLDESAYRTVMKSNPLPPLPEGMPQYNLMVGFTPGGLQ